nr:MAG TPA: hypothetical protein [Caudoviricetes sp.]
MVSATLNFPLRKIYTNCYTRYSKARKIRW